MLTTARRRSTPWLILRMTEAASDVERLLQRSVRAGIAPSAVAEWGRVGHGTSWAVTGAAQVLPERSAVNSETWFDLASLTKPLATLTLTLLAFRTHDLTPESRLGEVLDEFRGCEIGGLPIKSILTHTSGLPAWLPLYCLADGNPKVLLSRLAAVGLEKRPGAEVVYSCIGFVILGMVLARHADMALDRLFHQQVAVPLGLQDDLGFMSAVETHSLCGGATEPTTEKRLVTEQGWDSTLVPAWSPGQPDDGNARFLGGAAGNAGLFGTARGVRLLAGEYLPAGGSLLTGDEARRATRLYTEGLAQERGWGWQLGGTTGASSGPALSTDAFGHNGFTGVSVWCEPDDGGVFVLLTNRNHPSQRENDLHPLRRRFHTLAVSDIARITGLSNTEKGQLRPSGAYCGEAVECEEKGENHRRPGAKRRR